MKDYRRNLLAARLLVALLAAGCSEGLEPGAGADLGADTDGLRSTMRGTGELSPALEEGRSWLVATAYLSDRQHLAVAAASERTDWAALEANVELERTVPVIPAALAPEAGEDWSRIIVWEYRVTRVGFVPETDSVFYSASLDEGGTPQPLVLIAVEPYVEFNTGSLAKVLDLRAQLALRADDHTLLAALFNYRGADGRVTDRVEYARAEGEALVRDPGLGPALVDVALPDFTLAAVEADEMTVTAIRGGGHEVAFTNALDGGLVVQRWDSGLPWFTTSRSDRRLSWLFREE